MTDLTAQQLFAKAVDAHRNGDLDSARHLYNETLKIQSCHPQAHHNVGIVEFKAGNAAKALAAFQQALSQAPGNGNFWVSYVSALVSLGRTKEAEQAMARAKAQGAPESLLAKLTQLLDYKPAHATQQSLGPPQERMHALFTLYQNGQFRKLEGEAAALHRYFPESFSLINILSAAHAGQGNFDSAIHWAEKSLALYPESAEAHYNLGVVCKQAGRAEDAIRAYRNALRR